MNPTLAKHSIDERLQALRAAGAAQREPLRWHYIEELSRRKQDHAGKAQDLLRDKLIKALDEVQARLASTSQAASGTDMPPTTAASPATPSALTQLLQHMRFAGTSTTTPPKSQAQRPGVSLPPENPRVQKFRQQLRKISVKKQVQKALDQAPPNAGPINSHMLVLRALGLMRDISPDYLDRFMTHVDTLLCLEDAEKNRLTPSKQSAAAGKSRR